MTEAAPASSAVIAARYRAARARLMGSPEPTRQVPSAERADATSRLVSHCASGPACWQDELTAFNEELRRLFIPRRTDPATVCGEQIRAVVADHYGLTLAELCGGRLIRRCAWPRQVAMYICARQAALSTPDIARLFGNRDESTVLFALRAVAARMALNPALKVEIAMLIARCDAGALA
jgi:hypothetical protein